MRAGEKEIEERPESMDVGRGRDDAPRELFRRRELRRERPAALPGQGGLEAGLIPFLEELGDAEVEESDLAVLSHEHVRGLDVAMDDEVRVRQRHGFRDIEKEAEAGRNVEPAVVAVAVDLLAVDVLEHEVRLSP